MKPRKDYDTEAARLATAIDFAIESFQKYPPKDFNESHIQQMVRVYTDFKNSALNPELQYKKMVSLKYIIQDVFIYFQESSGMTVEYFWEQIKKGNLGYAREDKLAKILNRGKLKGRIEYEYLIDVLNVAKQERNINEEEFLKLNNMIGKFEARKNT